MKIILVSLLMCGGLFFFIVGTVGIIRFPDIFTRAHCAAKCDTLGVVLCSLSLVIFNGFNFVSLKIILIIIFVWVTNPIATHLIAKSEYVRRNSMNEMVEVKGFENV